MFFQQLTERGINDDNNIHVNLESTIKQHQSKVKLALINIHSLKNKEDILLEYINDSKTSICVITETWLRDGEDNCWLEGTMLNQNGLHCETKNRKNRKKKRGGGLACITDNSMKITNIKSNNTLSFEHAIWKITESSQELHIFAVYRPPDDSINNFIDEFLETLTETVLNYKNLIILGDFNLRINDDTEIESQMFIDAMYALGLNQQVTFTTHQKGNILDLIFTEHLSLVKNSSCSQRPFLSDHCVVELTTLMPKTLLQRKKVEYRKIKNIDIKEFMNDLHVDTLLEMNSLTTLLQRLEHNAKTALDKHAPLKKKVMTVRKPIPWFTDDVRAQKRTVRNRE
jgi:exonuclease III